MDATKIIENCEVKHELNILGLEYDVIGTSARTCRESAACATSQYFFRENPLLSFQLGAVLTMELQPADCAFVLTFSSTSSYEIALGLIVWKGYKVLQAWMEATINMTMKKLPF